MQGFPVYQQNQNKGTLAPGQTISVNKYTVQVERYLSQGGFAHVYLVRTATPVYGTTHHVLKRIAVNNEAMLTDVKKEVDIMRLLKGHPNIVHLIDAAWHRMSNGLYEVFILMEFCPGGGIIDMMNRRLRERLTEAEILQIFVDVCEGVAYMHNSRPPLLHRDLKVENILQASPTSFKLCDFGSATTVATRLPQSAQEFRALEDDLNRHTTMQYRAPEMIDVHMRRPVDEKSDVWALGVLLYKLCYYTTPFEEHGPLAILNVQYKTPPYPVYSSHMRDLISSMLREHGNQRPNVFELLNQVHRLRGTKSQFQYNIPAPKPLSPRQSTFKASPAQNNPASSTISYRQAPTVASNISPKVPSPVPSPGKNAGVQARDKVLEAIAPMRRGRPATSKEPTSSRAASPEKGKNWLDDEEKAWQTVSKNAPSTVVNLDDAFSVSAPGSGAKKSGQKGFGDDFGQQLWNAPDPNTQPAPSSSNIPSHPPLKSTIQRFGSLSRAGTRAIPTAQKEKDAFDGLGFGSSEQKPAPTLAEARKLRTGLAAPTSAVSPSASGKYSQPTRPSLSTNPSYNSSSPSQSLIPPPLKPSGSGSSWSSQPPSRPLSTNPNQGTETSAETRFPSLEELDASFAPKSSKRSSVSVKPGLHSSSQPQLGQPPQSIYSPDNSKTGGGNSRVPFPEPPKSTPMRGTYSTPGAEASKISPAPSSATSTTTAGRQPSLIRRHRSSVTIKHGSQADSASPSSSYLKSSTKESSAAQEKVPAAKPQQTDWLTGDDDSLGTSSTSMPARRTSPAPGPVPVVRDSPSKRASFIEKSAIPIQEALVATHERIPSPPPKDRASAIAATYSTMPDSPSSRAHRIFPELETTMEPAQSSEWRRHAPPSPSPRRNRKQTVESVSSADEEGPEEAGRYVPRTTKPSESRNAKPQRKGRQSSVHDLVDLYGGGMSPTKERDNGDEVVRSTGTPVPSRTTGGQSRAGSLASPMPVPSRRKSVSPQPLASPLDRPPTGQSAKSPSIASPTSSTSSRSRPQSMFIFPSKSTGSSGVPLSAGLAPPPDAEPQRHTRRNSITDMVQRFEAIDAVARSSAISTVSQRPNLNKADSSSSTNSVPPPRRSQMNGKGSSFEPNATGLNKPKTPSQANRRVSPSGLGRISPSPSPGKPQEVEVVTPRPRRISTRPDGSSNPVLFPVSRQTSNAEESTQNTDVRSPSPERPYQGVGKLIDQWQRKTAEPENPRSPIPKRGTGFVAKRAGLVNGQTK
ncbi:Ark- serine/threonine protein kinase [Marasmius tenuissimus]|nr:Ark- serine/threonine protein kinase [Marasmius tenuissimus]